MSHRCAVHHVVTVPCDQETAVARSRTTGFAQGLEFEFTRNSLVRLRRYCRKARAINAALGVVVAHKHGGGIGVRARCLPLLLF